MQEKKNSEDINTLLEQAISQYDFDLMIDCIKKGSNLDHMVLHRIINQDRVDLLDYLLFSPELTKKFPLHYDYDVFGRQPAFLFACSCDSPKIVDYLLNESTIQHSFEPFDFQNISQNSLRNACQIGSIGCVELLLSHEKTKNYCSLDFNNFEAIKNLDQRIIDHKPLHPELMEHLVLTQDIQLVHQMESSVYYLKDVYTKTLAMRELSERLNKLSVKKTNNNKLKI